MFNIFGWIFYGLIVGLLAKAIHPGKDPSGFLSTLSIGIVGSFVGGFINWLIGWGTTPFSTSGLLMGIIGGVLFLCLRSSLIKNDMVKK